MKKRQILRPRLLSHILWRHDYEPLAECVSFNYGIFRDISNLTTGLYWTIQDYTGLYRTKQTYTGQYRDKHDYTGLYRNIWDYKSRHRTIQNYLGL